MDSTNSGKPARSFGDLAKSPTFLTHAIEAKKKKEGQSKPPALLGMKVKTDDSYANSTFFSCCDDISRRPLPSSRGRSRNLYTHSSAPPPSPLLTDKPTAGKKRERSRSRSPIGRRGEQVREIGRSFKAKPMMSARVAAQQVAMRSHVVLSQLQDVQDTLKAYGGRIASGLLYVASMVVPGEYGQKAAQLRPFMVDNSTAVIVDIRETLAMGVQMNPAEVCSLLGRKSEFAMRISGDDIRIIEYPDGRLGGKPDELRDDYRAVMAGRGDSRFGIDYKSIVPCTGVVALSRVLEVLFGYSDPRHVAPALKGDVEEVMKNFSVSAKVTLTCMRESLNMLIRNEEGVFWEVWPDNREKWPFTPQETDAAITYLQEYFTLLIEHEFETAATHYKNMDAALGQNILINFNLLSLDEDMKDMDEGSSEA